MHSRRPNGSSVCGHGISYFLSPSHFQAIGIPFAAAKKRWPCSDLMHPVFLLAAPPAEIADAVCWLGGKLWLGMSKANRNEGRGATDTSIREIGLTVAQIGIRTTGWLAPHTTGDRFLTRDWSYFRFPESMHRHILPTSTILVASRQYHHLVGRRMD